MPPNPQQPFVAPQSIIPQNHSHSPLLPVLTIIVIVLALGVAWYAKIISFSSSPSVASAPTTESVPVVNSSATVTLSEGTYALVGHGAGQSANYAGTVKITKRVNTNDVYDLVWNITSGQAQLGVGILTNDVLSVSYYETTSDGFFRDIGVVSYKVLNLIQLQGEWTSVTGGTAGFEELTLQPQLPINK